jgi:hypothetical protein
MNPCKTAIFRGFESFMAYKTEHGIAMTGEPVKPAEPIKEVIEYEGDAEIVQDYLKECKMAQDASERRRKPVQYHPDPKMNQIVKAYCEMGGISLEKLIKPFKLEPPAIELSDIFEFV